MHIRYHLDENIHGGVGRGLARRGMDVTTTHDARLLGSTDETQLEFASSEARVLVTHDPDLLSISEVDPIGWAPNKVE
jgi:predicted nuclease of predicted toxin-antitoxin system